LSVRGSSDGQSKMACFLPRHGRRPVRNWREPNTEYGTALTDCITGKGYLDFTNGNKLLGTGIGFWVNRRDGAGGEPEIGSSA
jgi:hypothetical protein